MGGKSTFRSARYADEFMTLMRESEIMNDEQFRSHPKVIKARRLLIEAEQDVIRRDRTKTANHLCECEHARKWHGPSYDINYTQGVCSFEGCECMHFLMHKKYLKGRKIDTSWMNTGSVK